MNPLLNPGTRISSVKYISCLVLVSYLTHTYVWSIYYLVLFNSEFYIKSLLFWDSCFDLTLHYQLDSSILFLSNIVCSFSWYNSTDLLLPSAWHCLVYVTLVYWFPSRAGILCFVYFMCLFFNNLIYYKICLLFSLLAFSFQYMFSLVNEYVSPKWVISQGNILMCVSANRKKVCWRILWWLPKKLY